MLKLIRSALSQIPHLAGTLSGILAEMGRIATVLEGLSKGLQGPGPTVDEARIVALEEAVDALPRKWSEIEREAKSWYHRASHHVRRARQELEDSGYRDPELDELARQVQPLDDEGGDEQGVLPLHGGMAESPQPVPEDWETLTIQRKYYGN